MAIAMANIAASQALGKARSSEAKVSLVDIKETW